MVVYMSSVVIEADTATERNMVRTGVVVMLKIEGKSEWVRVWRWEGDYYS